MEAITRKDLLTNVFAAIELGGVAARKARSEDFKTVRNPLVDEEVKNGWALQKKNRSSSRLKRDKPMDRAFEDKVWTLLHRMGFTHMSGQGGAHILLNENDPEGPDNQIDVVAIDDDVSLAIECKASGAPRKFADFSGDLGKHTALRERFTRAVRSQFPQEHKRPAIFAFWTTGIIVTEHDGKRADAENVTMFDDSDLAYYEQLVAQIGTAARFQFLADVLKTRPIPGLELKVPAIRTKMGGSWAYTFSVSPEYLLKVAFVSHRARGKASDIDAYQRLLKKSRLKSIRQYITDGGIFPTNIVVNIANRRWLTFDRGKQESEDSSQTLFGWLTIRPAFKVAWIIDGQHRLYAYANHPDAHKSLISVMAFVGLEASEQARLFIDINAEQRKVKQSLLQELYAELHWNAEEPEERVQAILSKAVQALDADLGSPLRGRVLKADEQRTDTRCISLTSVFRALERGTMFIARLKKGKVQEYGALWGGDNQTTLRRTIKLVSGYFDFVRQEATAIWDKGSGDGGGLAMNEGVTVCINVLRSVLGHLGDVKRLKLADLDDDELLEVVEPYARLVGKYFHGLSAEQLKQFRALRGVQGQTTGTRRVEEWIQKSEATFDPPGLSEFLSRARVETTKHAFQEIHGIETILQKLVISELKAEFGPSEQEWFFNGVPKGVRKKVDDRINEEGGKKGGREQNFDLIDYREIVHGHWTLFEKTLARGKTGAKDARTKWIVEVNELRKPVMHASKGQSLPISEEQLSQLTEIHEWLKASVSGQVEGP